MSLEQRLEDLTKAINDLPAKLAGLLNSGAQASTATGAQQTSDSASSEKQPKVDSEKAGDAEGGENIAGRKTYVWDKKEHTGQIIEKGEVVPTGPNLTNIGKSKWDELCKKYELDPTTGQPAEQEEEASEDLPGDDDLPSDNDLDLGLEEEEEPETATISPADAKKKLVAVMKTKGRETALKLMKKYGARSFEEVKESDYAAICKEADALVAG